MSSILHIYLQYGKDKYGDYIDKIYSPIILPENEDLEYIGEIDSSKKLNDDGRTYI